MSQKYYEDDAVTLYHRDCLDVLAELPDASVDAVANHPDPCEKHPEGDAVTCGWKSAYQDVVRALEVEE